MKTARLQAAFARKREAEHIRFERTQETNRYFDHWGKVTSRFQTWTTPEYYENAEKSVREQKKKQEKEIKLNERREKLQKLLDAEDQRYENELQAIILRKQSPSQLLSGRARRSRYDAIDTNILEKIKEHRADEMRRLELEAKLYKKWRNPNSGITLSTTPLAIVGSKHEGANSHLNEKSLFESKSDNEIMAKLNWLDKQIENQMRREEEEKEMQKQKLKVHKEARKREEIQRERQLIRESEIKELRAIQENHVAAIRDRELESQKLQEDEEHFRNILEAIDTELKTLKSNHDDYGNLLQASLPHNLNKIKILFRQLSDEYNERFRKDIECLKRIKVLYLYANDDNIEACNSVRSSRSGNDNATSGHGDLMKLKAIENLIEKFENQMNYENLNQSDICSMYESEAKNNFKKWQELWHNEELLRMAQIIQLLERDQIFYKAKLSDNIKQQKLVIEIRETHLAAIENSNEKLKMLIDSNGNFSNDSEAATAGDGTNQCDKLNGNLKNMHNNLILHCDDLNDCHGRSSRSCSRMSYEQELDSYRAESVKDYKNTKSRIFGWMDEEEDATDLKRKMQANRRDTSLPVRNQTSAKPKEVNEAKLSSSIINRNEPNIRADLISDFRQRNNHSSINTHTKLAETNNSEIFNDNYRHSNCDDSKIIAKNTSGNAINFNRRNASDVIQKEFESRCSITKDDSSVANLNVVGCSVLPKFGKKKVAWT